MLVNKEREVLVGFFVRKGRVLDFCSASFGRFVRSILYRDIPERPIIDLSAWKGRTGIMRISVERTADSVVSGEALGELEHLCVLRSLLAHYEALVEAGGLAALRLRDDYMHAVVRGIVMRECRERIGVLPSAREVLPDLEPPPSPSAPPADYFSALWKRSLQLFAHWNDIDPATLTRSDHLCHGFDAELLKLARAFAALDAVEDSLVRKRTEDQRIRISHILMRASPARKAIDAFVMKEVFVHQDEAPQWLADAVSRFNGEFINILHRYVKDIRIPVFMQMADAFTEVAECWNERGACLGMRRALHPSDDWGFRMLVSKFMRYEDCFVHELNLRECSNKSIFAKDTMHLWSDFAEGAASLTQRFADAQSARERTAAEYCANAARLLRTELQGVSTILAAAEYMLCPPIDSPVAEICSKAIGYRLEFGWSVARFKSICVCRPAEIRL